MKARSTVSPFLVSRISAYCNAALMAGVRFIVVRASQLCDAACARNMGDEKVAQRHLSEHSSSRYRSKAKSTFKYRSPTDNKDDDGSATSDTEGRYIWNGQGWKWGGRRNRASEEVDSRSEILLLLGRLLSGLGKDRKSARARPGASQGKTNLGDLATLAVGLLDRLDDTDSDGLTHVTDGEATERGVLGEGLDTHGLRGDHLDDGGVAGLDELRRVFNRLARAPVDFLKEGVELAGD